MHSPAGYTVFPRLSLNEAERLMGENHTALGALAASDSAALKRRVQYVNTSGHEFATTVEDILLHVVQHSMYHRGQVALLVRASGGTPLATDFIAFVRA